MQGIKLIIDGIEVIISDDMCYRLIYFDWDIDELEQGWSKIFPDAKAIEITDCEDKYIEVKVDGEYYVLDETGEIIEKGRL